MWLDTVLLLPQENTASAASPSAESHASAASPLCDSQEQVQSEQQELIQEQQEATSSRSPTAVCLAPLVLALQVCMALQAVVKLFLASTLVLLVLPQLTVSLRPLCPATPLK